MVYKRALSSHNTVTVQPVAKQVYYVFTKYMHSLHCYLQGRESTGAPGQYWRTLEEVEAEGSRPFQGGAAPGPWVSPFTTSCVSHAKLHAMIASACH